MNGSSGERTGRLTFQNLCRRLSRLGRRDLDGSIQAANVLAYLPVVPKSKNPNEKPGQPGQKASSYERHEQLTEVGIPICEEDSSSATIANRLMRGVPITTTVRGHTAVRNFGQCQSHHLHYAGTFRVPYIFEFVPFPGHTCMGRGTIPLGKIIVCVDNNSRITRAFKYNASFRSLLNKYNHNNRVIANDPVELRHVTGVTLRSKVEFRSSVRLVRDMRERKILVVTLLKSYPGCQECQERGRFHDCP